MATLHDAVDKTKKVLLVSSIAVLIILVIYYSYQGITAYIAAHQEAPPPTEDFDDLPDITFPPSATTKPLTYSLDTVTGDLPDDFPERMYVYKTIQPEPDLNNLKDAKTKVLGIKLATRERRITDTVYQWTDLKTYSRTIRMDIVSGKFLFTTNFMQNDAFLTATNTITSDLAQSTARKFFTNLGSFPSDIDDSATETKSFTIRNGQRVPSLSEADTKVIEVDYFQQDLSDDTDDYPIYYPKPDRSPINALVAIGDIPSVVEANYNYQEISDERGEYYIKSVDDAYEDLSNGKAYIAAYYGNDTNIKIQDVFLAYYIGEAPQEYVMPVVVFANKSKGFYAYVPAIDDYWNTPTPTNGEEK